MSDAGFDQHLNRRDHTPPIQANLTDPIFDCWPLGSDPPPPIDLRSSPPDPSDIPQLISNDPLLAHLTTRSCTPPPSPQDSFSHTPPPLSPPPPTPPEPPLHHLTLAFASTQDPCPICLEAYNTSHTHTPIRIVNIANSANHMFGRFCLLKWLNAGGKTCPICRAELVHAAG